MKDPHQLDEAALGAHLAAVIPGFGQLQSVRKFGAGQSNPTYHLRASGGDFVLRTKPPGTLLKSAHQVDREFRVMQALAGQGVPVPRMHYLSPEDSVIGRMFFVMDYVPGRIFWDPALPELAIAARAAIFDGMNRALAAIHNVDLAAAGLTDFGKPGSYFARQLARWTDQYRQSELTPLPDMHRLIDRLQDVQPADDGMVTLVHGDFRHDNMIFAADRAEVLAVLDWELSTLGHPLADLSYQCMQWRLPHDSGFRGLGGLDRAALGLPSERDYVRAYCRRRGLTGISHWGFYLAFAFFRLAAILQGVVKRAHDGNASNPERARQMAQAVPLIASAGLAVMAEGDVDV